jgi:hypothetical protein
MSLGRSPDQEDAFHSSTNFCRERLSPTSIYALLNRESHRLFPDEAFADLFCDIGRASVPPRITAVVMVLQRLEGLSDREAVDRFSFDLRWKYAAGGLDFDHPGFVHTVLVDVRARLRRSERPNRIFESADGGGARSRAHRTHGQDTSFRDPQDPGYWPAGHRYNIIAEGVPWPGQAYATHDFEYYSLFTNSCTSRFGFLSPASYSSYQGFYTGTYYWGGR